MRWTDATVYRESEGGWTKPRLLECRLPHPVGLVQLHLGTASNQDKQAYYLHCDSLKMYDLKLVSDTWEDAKATALDILTEIAVKSITDWNAVADELLDGDDVSLIPEPESPT